MRMIERIARAIHASVNASEAADLRWAEAGDEVQLRYLHAAGQAIRELRLPTDTMLAEGERRGLPHDAANVWERMLFAALTT